MTQAIIFDLDNCILDTQRIPESVLEPVLVPLLTSDLPEATKEAATRELWFSSIVDVGKHFGLPPAVTEAMIEAHRALVVPDDMELHTFGDEIHIPELQGIKFLVTSGSRNFQMSKIERLGIAWMFAESIVDAIDEPGRKGKQKIFTDIAQAYGWNPCEVVVVGDNPKSELAAGKAAGMITVQTVRPTVTRAEGFDHYITSLRELDQIIGR